VNYTDDNLRLADSALQRLYLALRDTENRDASPFPSGKGEAPSGKGEASLFSVRFAEAMDDDFNTPGAIAALQDIARELNVAKAAGDALKASALADELRQLGGVLGLLEHPPAEWLSTGSALTEGTQATSRVLDPAEIEQQIAGRIEARRQRQWAESDRIRDELAAAGVVLEDGPAGTTWRRK
jgi:cysteinyl-tRNA synthetase